jgi:hypothetical protein
VITPEDRTKYPHHTDGAIYGIKLIGGLTDSAVFQGMAEIYTGWPGPVLMSLQTLMDAGRDLARENSTNPNWIVNRVCEEAYRRKMIDENTLDRYGR